MSIDDDNMSEATVNAANMDADDSEHKPWLAFEEVIALSESDCVCYLKVVFWSFP